MTTTVDMALLPPAVQKQITAALAAGDTIALTQAGEPAALIGASGGRLTTAEYLASPKMVRGYEAGRAEVAANLLARLRRVAEPDGSWTTSRAIDVLTNWFVDLGIDPELPPRRVTIVSDPYARYVGATGTVVSCPPEFAADDDDETVWVRLDGEADPRISVVGFGAAEVADLPAGR